MEGTAVVGRKSGSPPPNKPLKLSAAGRPTPGPLSRWPSSCTPEPSSRAEHGSLDRGRPKVIVSRRGFELVLRVAALDSGSAGKLTTSIRGRGEADAACDRGHREGSPVSTPTAPNPGGMAGVWRMRPPILADGWLTDGNCRGWSADWIFGRASRVTRPGVYAQFMLNAAPQGTRSHQGKLHAEIGQKKRPVKTGLISGIMVGAKGFEPSTPRSRTECSTRLSHAPTVCLSYRTPLAFPKLFFPAASGPGLLAFRAGAAETPSSRSTVRIARCAVRSGWRGVIEM